jgi:membrane protein
MAIDEADEKGGAPDPDDPRKPESPTDLTKPSTLYVLRKTAREFQHDQCTDLAAALTYYAVLSLFPAVLVVVSLLGVFGQGRRTTDAVLDIVSDLAPGSAVDTLRPTVQQLVESPSAGFALILGIATALWSASGYVAAFMRASNSIYDIEEGRPIWKTAPVRVGVTLVLVILLIVCAVAVVFTGGLAQQAGNVLGLGSSFVDVWDIAKWPVLLIIVSFMFALLYWASPNARTGGFKWVSAGGVVGVVLWLAASALFALYIATMGSGSYNKTYGALAGVVIFLVWLWISNVAILLGAEFNAELERGRRIEAGHPADREPFVEPRDTRKMSDEGKAELQQS